jgi:hypothetical protein
MAWARVLNERKKNYKLQISKVEKIVLNERKKKSSTKLIELIKTFNVINSFK